MSNGRTRGTYGAIGVTRRGIPLKAGGSIVAAGVAPGPNTVQFDPYLFPPPASTPINIAGNQAIVGANTFTTPAALTRTIPNNCYGVISTIDLLLDSILITSVVNWYIFVNGSPVPGFNPITILGRNGAASVGKSWDGPLRILIPLGGTVSVTIQDVDGGAYTAGTSLYGWFFPQQR
jgi:hypothetical protein